MCPASSQSPPKVSFLARLLPFPHGITESQQALFVVSCAHGSSAETSRVDWTRSIAFLPVAAIAASCFFVPFSDLFALHTSKCAERSVEIRTKEERPDPDSLDEYRRRNLSRRDRSTRFTR